MNENLSGTWERYTSTRKMTDKVNRQKAFQEALADQAIYTDPLVQTTSWDALIQYMEDFHQQVPGGHFVTTYFLSHHKKSVAKWDMKTRENVTIGSGISYGEYNDLGKLVSVNGFFENNS